MLLPELAGLADVAVEVAGAALLVLGLWIQVAAAGCDLYVGDSMARERGVEVGIAHYGMELVLR